MVVMELAKEARKPWETGGSEWYWFGMGKSSDHSYAVRWLDQDQGRHVADDGVPELV
jgi:hypothetical protein